MHHGPWSFFALTSAQFSHIDRGLSHSPGIEATMTYSDNLIGNLVEIQINRHTHVKYVPRPGESHGY